MSNSEEEFWAEVKEATELKEEELRKYLWKREHQFRLGEWERKEGEKCRKGNEIAPSVGFAFLILLLLALWGLYALVVTFDGQCLV